MRWSVLLYRIAAYYCSAAAIEDLLSECVKHMMEKKVN